MSNNRVITGATDTPTNADDGYQLIVDRSGAGDCTVTLDTDANQTWDVGDYFIVSAHDGDAIIDPATGVTVDGSNDTFTVPEGFEVGLQNVDGANVWQRTGGLLTPLAPVTESGTTFTLSATHYGKIVRCTNASAVTATIPTDASDDLPDGFWCILVAEGAGGVTFSTTGITLAGSSPNTTIAQNEAIMPVKTAAANTWQILGGTAA